MKAADAASGISIRFVQQFDIVKDQWPHRSDFFSSLADAALALAMYDARDVPMADKVVDAWEFIHSTRPKPDAGA